MFCKECGKEIAEDSKFCQYCGAKLTTEKKLNITNNFVNNIVEHKILSLLIIIYLLWVMSDSLQGSTEFTLGDYNPVSDFLIDFIQKGILPLVILYLAVLLYRKYKDKLNHRLKKK